MPRADGAGPRLLAHTRACLMSLAPLGALAARCSLARAVHLPQTLRLKFLRTTYP